MLRAKQQGHQLTPGGFSLHTQPALSPVPLSGPVSLPCPSHTPLSFHPGLVPHSHHTCSPWASAPAIPTTWGLPPGSPNGGGGVLLVTTLERRLIPPGSRATPRRPQVSQHSAHASHSSSRCPAERPLSNSAACVSWPSLRCEKACPGTLETTSLFSTASPAAGETGTTHAGSEYLLHKLNG